MSFRAESTLRANGLCDSDGFSTSTTSTSRKITTKSATKVLRLHQVVYFAFAKEPKGVGVDPSNTSEDISRNLRWNLDFVVARLVRRCFFLVQ